MEPSLVYSRSDSEDAYGLIRLVAINSYKKYQARALYVDNHTHVSGRNGRGKTTLLRLIPLFYGEQPSKMVKPSGEVLRSIREYLFDSLSSYLVFEYRNHDGIKLVIMYYGSADSPSYILCDGPYVSELFVEDGRFIESRHLNTRLKIHKRNPTPSLGVMDYQCVIQGRGQTRNEVRVYSRRFALAEKGNLAGIEKIASAMFFKDITFPALKRMAYSVTEGYQPDQVLGTSMTEKMLTQFFVNFKAYQAVMKHAQAFIDGTNAQLRIAEAKRERQTLSIKANLLSRHLHDEIEATNQELARIQDAFADVSKALYEQKRGLLSRRSAAAAEHESAVRLIAKVDREEQEFAARDMARLRSLVAAIGTLEQTIDNRQDMLRNLSAQSDDIRGKYAQQEAAVLTQYTERLRPLDAKRDGVRVRLTAEQERIEHERALTQALFGTWRDEQLCAFDNRLHKAQKALEDARLVHAGLREADEFAARRDELKIAEQNIRDELEQLHCEARQVADEMHAAKLQFAARDVEFNAANRILSEKQDQLARLLSLESPAEGSVLRFLREAMPNWYGNIGRVVRGDILLRTDLNPTVADEAGVSIYGLSLDLDKVDASLAGQEEALAGQIGRARTEVDHHRSQAAAIESHMSKLTKQINELASAQAVNDHKLVERKKAAERVHAAAITNDRAAHEELGERRASHEMRIKEARSSVDLLMAEQTELKGEIDRRGLALKTQYNRRLDEARQLEKAELDAIKADMEALEQDKTDTVRRLRDACEQELRAGRSNVEGLRQIEQQIKSEKATLEAARNARADVEKYERWLDVGPGERRQARECADQYALELAELDEAIARADNQAEATNRLLRERQESIQKKLQATAECRRLVDEFRRTHSTEGDGYELADGFEPIGASLEGIATAYARASAQMLQFRNERDQKIQPIHSLFARAEPDSHIAQASRDLPRIYSDTEQQSSVAAIIDVLKRWYDSGHAQSRESLNGECRAACQLFVTYLGKLRDFQSRMLSLSRQLQNSLDTEMVFDAIRRVSIRLSGRVERVPYWSPLNALETEFKRWEETGCAGIPPQSLINQLVGLAAQIPGGRIEESPENLIDMEIIVDDGTEKRVSNETELKNVSSNGLSSMILCMIFVAFVNRVRRDDQVWLTWALDEIGTIDAGNAKALLEMLALHRIRLISASPEGRESTLAMFKNHYEILPDFEIQRCVPAQRRRHVG